MNPSTMQSPIKHMAMEGVDIEKHTSPSPTSDAHVSAFKGLGWLDRLLALWIVLAMVIGVLLGNFVPNVGPALQRGTFVGVSVPIGKYSSHGICDSWLTSVIAIGLLVMMYPILCKIKFETLHLVFRQRSLWIQIGFSVVMNWLVAPFVMVSFVI
jgi:ACR3 family arsenite transporter